MPTLSVFYGIIVKLNSGNEHNPPHVHVFYSGKEASFDFNGKLLVGRLPAKQTALMKAWILLHQDELFADWELARQGEEVLKIKPLQ